MLFSTLFASSGWVPRWRTRFAYVPPRAGKRLQSRTISKPWLGRERLYFILPIMVGISARDGPTNVISDTLDVSATFHCSRLALYVRLRAQHLLNESARLGTSCRSQTARMGGRAIFSASR